jgi:hypothetical protein
MQWLLKMVEHYMLDWRFHDNDTTYNGVYKFLLDQ